MKSPSLGMAHVSALDGSAATHHLSRYLNAGSAEAKAQRLADRLRELGLNPDDS